MRKRFFKKSHGAWYCQLSCGKQVRLRTDKDDAFREYHRIMAGELPVTSGTTVHRQTLQPFRSKVRTNAAS